MSFMWTWDPSVIIWCVGLAIGYLALAGGRPGWKALPFLAGVGVLLLALVSPLDALGDAYLFSAHMLQHELLILAVPPLLLLGIPAGWVERARRKRLAARVECAARNPWLAWLVGTITIWLWHLPALYNAALGNQSVHLAEHLSFLVSSFIFWWPVLSPVKEQRMKPVAGAAYLVLAAAACDALGFLLAYAPPGIYPAYLQPAERYHILSLLRDTWRISPSTDQQAGGLLMGIAGDAVYVFVALVELGMLSKKKEKTPAA